MSSNPQDLNNFLKNHGVVPLASVGNLQQALSQRTQAQPKTLAVLEAAGFTWNEAAQMYVDQRQYEKIAAFPSRVYIWIHGEYGKIIKNTNELQAWLSGPNKTFMSDLADLTGESGDPVIPQTTATRPTPPSKEDHVAKILKNVKAGSRLAADQIIDLYKVAKETGNSELMSLVKTLQLKENKISRSELKAVLKEIVKGVFKEMTTTAAAAPVSTPKAFSRRGVKQEEEQIEEMTTTGDVQGYNVPGAFARKGGSQKGVAGSGKLGYELTALGKKEMDRQGDPIYENKNPKRK